jgi:hypothetical protein
VTQADVTAIVDALTPVIRRELQAVLGAKRPADNLGPSFDNRGPGYVASARRNSLMPGPMQAVVAGRIPLPYPLFDELVGKLGGEREAGEARVREWAQERLLSLPEGPVPGGADNYKWWRAQAEQTLLPKATKGSERASANEQAAADYLASLKVGGV